MLIFSLMSAAHADATANVNAAIYRSFKGFCAELQGSIMTQPVTQ